MKKVEALKYKLHYNPEDSEEFKISSSDVFYEYKGKLYKQFYKGQPLPLEVWSEIFEEPKISDEKEVEVEDNKSIDKEIKNKVSKKLKDK